VTGKFKEQKHEAVGCQSVQQATLGYTRPASCSYRCERESSSMGFQNQCVECRATTFPKKLPQKPVRETESKLSPRARPKWAGRGTNTRFPGNQVDAGQWQAAAGEGEIAVISTRRTLDERRQRLAEWGGFFATEEDKNRCVNACGRFLNK
jgi:hypothetical protein